MAANAVRRQIRDLRAFIQPAFASTKLEQELKPREVKAVIVNQQCAVYYFSCDLCDADYVVFTARHLHLRTRIVHFTVVCLLPGL